ncbi:TrkH family potassium uptake protein [Sulfitobacter sabulilitoris]|uniref:TrkH family potassium uptake protein n=1 Tax=Sulfitobacter sabulilitoris TaxID=2562655 RepID=UPI0014792BDE|nr:TrkH family potassium uptake protein [Sulfitobacter sabulilitoris]
MRSIRKHLSRKSVWRLPPPALLALIYVVCILLGAGLLMLPVSNTNGIAWADALFTSTSAVTVTGLVVVDTGSAFTHFGQGVIAFLIQMGGLGLMTFAVLVLSALGIPIGMPQRLILREDLNQTKIGNLTTLVWIILRIAILCEALGVLVLSFVFVPEFGLWEGLWQAVFHSVSAFNNAGFALFPDSLSRWVANPVVNVVIPAMFILGGIGFIVVGDLWQKRSWRRLTLHSKLMLSGTAVLILWSWVMFALLEWTNPGTLGGLQDTGARLWASWFQAVTPRTAGFNTLDTGAMRDSTTLMTMTLMLVGGGSTSTAGGIKVTTLIVLVMATLAFFKRRSSLHAFGRSLGLDEVMKVMALTTISLLLVLSGLFIMSITHDGEIFDLAFEVTSAFGTVGLSRGATAELDGIGRAMIIVIMFLGRVGPLTIGFFLATQSVPRVRYPAGQVYLG